jgi:hypothetical protein
MNGGTPVVANLKIAEGTYGGATEAIRRTLRSAELHQWFPKVTVDDRATAAVRDRMTRHFEELGEIATAASLSIDFIQGGWNVLADTYRTINPAGNDPAYGRGQWRSALDIVAGEMRHDLERSNQQVIVPPLFPVAGDAGIVGGMLTTEMGGAKIVSDETQRQTVWHLMCDVDADFWSAIIWPLAHEVRRNLSPFEELVETYMSGFYPLGFIGERFIVYSYA